MLASSLVVTTPVSVLAAGISDVGGWNETIYATLSGVSDADVTSVSYSGTISVSYTHLDVYKRQEMKLFLQPLRAYRVVQLMITKRLR